MEHSKFQWERLGGCIFHFHKLTVICQVALKLFVFRIRNSNFPKFGLQESVIDAVKCLQHVKQDY